jgi:hypothetical protein
MTEPVAATNSPKPKAYINECANCDQLAVMKKRDLPWHIWGNYCPACIDSGEAQKHWNEHA